MTAPFPESSATPAARVATPAGEFEIRHVGRVCHTAIDGRLSVRALAQWSARFGFSEPEFQVLWCLRDLADGLDQTTLAKRLAFSPAQVSSTVEKMRARGWILQRPANGDRRRHLWHLSALGGGAIDEMLRVADELRFAPQSSMQTATAGQEREAA